MAMVTPEFLQTKTFAAIKLRQVFLDLPMQEGVVGPTDFKVTQRALGASLAVDVAAGASFIQGDIIVRQGLYHVYNDGVVTLAIGSNSSGLPRVDQIVARVYDSTDGLQGVDQATLEVIAGTPTAGATLDNRSGAAALPSSVIRLADVLVASSASTITNSVIRDRRPWARGALSTLEDTTSGTLVLSATTYTTGAMLSGGPMRVECSGVPVMISASVIWSAASASVHTTSVAVILDGTVGGSAPILRETLQSQEVAATAASGLHPTWIVSGLSAGSHTFDLGVKVSAGSSTIERSASRPLGLYVRELPTLGASNT